MKEQIIDIITDWIFDNKIDIKCTSEMAIDLATRLDKAIGIDDDAVWRKIVEFRSSGRKIIDASDCGDVAVLIAQSRPLKCEVGDE